MAIDTATTRQTTAFRLPSQSTPELEAARACMRDASRSYFERIEAASLLMSEMQADDQDIRDCMNLGGLAKEWAQIAEMRRNTKQSTDQPADDAKLWRLGQEAEGEGNIERAIDFYERALGENPDNEIVCFQLALLYDRRGEDNRAIELYERLCTSEPAHVNALLNLAILYEDNNFYDKAKRCLNAVLANNPNHVRARLYMMDVMSARSKFVDDTNIDAERTAAMEIPITDFELSVRSRNALKRMKVRTLGDLLKIGEQELLAHKNFGETSLNEIKSLLAARGLRLGQNAKLLDAADVKGDIPKEILCKSINGFELSARSRKVLQRLKITTIGELARRTEDEMLGCKNCGPASLNELKQLLAQFSMSFRSLSK